MGKGSSGPSPGQMAQAQSQANQQAALQSILLSQINQVTPFGKQTWSGSIPIVDQQTGKVTSYVNLPEAGQGSGGQFAPAAGGGGGGGAPAGGGRQLIGQYGPGGELGEWVDAPAGGAGDGTGGSAGGGGTVLQGQGAFSPRTLTTELSPHGQYMQQGQENIAKALLDRASRTTTQVQGQQAFKIGDLGLPSQVGNVGMSRMLSQFSPVGAAGMSPMVSQIAKALLRRG